MQVVVVAAVFRRRGPVLAAAEVATAAAAATAIAAGHDGAHEEDCLPYKEGEVGELASFCGVGFFARAYLARGRRDHKVRVDILLAKLFRDVEPQRAVVVVDVPFGQVTEYRVGAVHLFELGRNANQTS